MKIGERTSDGRTFAVVCHANLGRDQNKMMAKRDGRPLSKNVDHTPHIVLSISVIRLDIVFA